MMRYVWKRLRTLPFSLLFVLAVTFCVLRLTGNPIDNYLGLNRTPEQVEALTVKLHLDKPLPVQFAIYLRDVVRGDFGESLQYKVPATSIVFERLGYTLQLLSFALSLALVAGITAGIVSAVRKNRLTDHFISTIAIVSQSMPSFWLGLLLIQLFALQLGWLPTSGQGGIQHLILPGVTLAAYLVPNFILITRTSVLEVMDEQYVHTARAKGLSGTRTLLFHVLPNAINPVLSFLGLQIGKLMGGSIITETIFAWPGIGRLLVGSVFQRDIPVVAATVVVMSVVILVANLLVDIALSMLDPRTREE